MKVSVLFVALVAVAALALLFWRAVFDTAALPPRLMSDMVARPAEGACLPGRVPFEPEGCPVEDGPALFAAHCAHCHGADGSGRSYVAARPGMPDVSDLRLNPAPDAQKRASLSEGRGAMPAFGRRLRPSAIEALHLYILSLNPRSSP